MQDADAGDASERGARFRLQDRDLWIEPRLSPRQDWGIWRIIQPAGELWAKGIDFIAHYISQTASNTAGFGGSATTLASALARLENLTKLI